MMLNVIIKESVIIIDPSKSPNQLYLIAFTGEILLIR